MRVPSDVPRKAPRKRRMSHRGRIAIIAAVALLVVLFLSARGIAGFYTDYLWFASVGQGAVFRNILGARIALAVIFTLLFAVLLLTNLLVADRLAPKLREPGPEEQFIERYQQVLGRRRVMAYVVVSLVFGMVAGIPVSSQWRSWLLFVHAQRFGVPDALFGVDIGFYVFRLPFLTFVLDWLFAAMVIVLVITTVSHYLNGGIRLQVQGQRVTPQVKLHLSILLAILALLRAGSYWLQQYTLTTSTRGYVDGATFTDVNAQLPAIRLLALISVVAAVLLIANVWRRGWRLPVIAVGLWALVALVAGTIYPAFVQRFQVEPAESNREALYIERNIAATREAMGLSGVQSDPYTVGTANVQAIQESSTVGNSRLIDPSVMLSTYQRLQGQRSFYRFTDLDVDRYTIDGKTEQAVIGVRELNADDLPNNSWENQHLAYTHGYGVAVAPANKVQPNGQPAFLDTSGNGSGPALARPEVYFGEGLTDYAVVATQRDEISLNNGADTTTKYQGTGGVRLSSRLRRAAFAVRFGEWNLFGSNLITGDSRILFNRDIRDRVRTLAPFLDFDADPYAVVIDGRIKWIVDGYTTTDRYPYAQLADTDQLALGSGLNHPFNYVRNSVKAVVDAYDGTVNFYVVDPTDPIVRAYQAAFPSLFTDADQASPELRAHFRYPEDLFRVQTNVWARYHIDDAKSFYQRDTAWSVAQDAAKSQASAAPTQQQIGGISVRAPETRFAPYYGLVQLPGTTKPQFVLVRPFSPFSEQGTRRELTAIMTASSDPDTYGKLRVLTMPAPLPDGPALVATNIQQTFAADLTLLDQQGSRVSFGDLQALPVGDTLVWVRPWYVQATGSSPVPELHAVTVTYNKQSYQGPTLEAALKAAFPGGTFDFGSVTGGEVPSQPGSDTSTGGGATTTTPATTAPGSTARPPTTAAGTQSVEELLSLAQLRYQEAQAALKQSPPDLGTYQKKIDEAFALVQKAASLATGAPVTAVGPSTTAGATISPSGASPSTTISA